MATKKNNETIAEGAAAVSIDDAAYYRVEVSSRFKVQGVGFGQRSTTDVTGALLRKVLASEFADKVTGYAPV